MGLLIRIGIVIMKCIDLNNGTTNGTTTSEVNGDGFQKFNQILFSHTFLCLCCKSLNIITYLLIIAQVLYLKI